MPSRSGDIRPQSQKTWRKKAPKSAKNDFTFSNLGAKLFVIKLRPYSMLKCTLTQFQQCFQNFAVPSRSGDMRLQSKKTWRNKAPKSAKNGFTFSNLGAKLLL